MLTDIILVDILPRSINMFLLIRVDILYNIYILFLHIKSFKNVKTKKIYKKE
mgnify:CR=1 FL=1